MIQKKRQNYFELTRCNNEYYNKYLVETDYIDYQAVEIKKLSEKLKLNNLSPITISKQLAIFCKSVIRYDYKLAKEISEGKTLGKRASEVCLSCTGTCGEYVNLFIALMRLNNIPCKYVAGLYYSEKQTYVHAWAEFFDNEYGWVSVDPQSGIIGISENYIKLFEGVDIKDAKIDFNNFFYNVNLIN